MVALISESSSSSPLMASWRWRGVILFTFKSLEALPANSSTYGVRVKRYEYDHMYRVILLGELECQEFSDKWPTVQC